MRFLGIQDLRADLPQIVRAVAEGESEVVVTRHGKPVAALIDLATIDEFIRYSDRFDREVHPELQELCNDLALLIAGRDTETAWVFLCRSAEAAREKLQKCNPASAREDISREVIAMIHMARRRSFKIEAFAKSARA
jgi:prevent-host-death family protein